MSHLADVGSAPTPALLHSLWKQSDALLNGTLVASGVEIAGDDAPLACLRAALRSRSRVTVGSIGGSITAGSSYGTGHGSASFLYHTKLIQALDKLYPTAGGHVHHNGGVPGTGAALHALPMHTRPRHVACRDLTTDPTRADAHLAWPRTPDETCVHRPYVHGALRARPPARLGAPRDHRIRGEH